MIILSDERHNRFLDATLTGYDKREDCLKAAASIIYNARRDRLLGSSLESSMALPQVTNLVMRVPEDDYHIKTIVSIFQDHIENKGITQAGVLKVLRAVDIAIDPNPWCNTEIRGFERLTNTLIAQWQKENMSDSELAEMLENMNCVDEEIDRTEELAALGLGRVISSGQEDIPVADEGQDASSSSEDPIQDRPSLVMGEEGNSQHWTTATLESSDESDVSEFQATPFESA
ncbi:hypothetical protein MMC27_006430 [Xylographa pallens]|nr:hypothetical protein [Xylographa pallens]